ncbi:ABC transporter ATP-binding protein [Methanococcoides sp. SA1]|nr:ABC transporter ATP-binding protein [Methanococcoides sp. SA1]
MVNKKMKKNEKKIDWRYNLSEYWDAMRNWKGLALALLISILTIEVTGIIPNFLFKEIVDKGTLFATGDFGLEEFKILLLAIVGIYVLFNLVNVAGLWFRNRFGTKLELRMMTYLKMKYFNHIVKLDQSFHSTHKTGSLISRMNRGIASVERITDIIMYGFLGPFFQLVIVGLSIAYFDTYAAAAILGIIGCFVLFSILYQRRQTPLKVVSNASEDDEKAGISDVFTNIDSIKYFGRENWISKSFRKLASKVETTNFKLWTSYAWLTSGQVLIITAGTIVLLLFPILRFLDGVMTLGEVVFIYTVYRSLMGPMWGFIDGFQGFQRAIIDFQDLFDYGKIESNIKDKVGAKTAFIDRGEIEFRDIDFSYTKRKKIFRDFDLVIPAKKKVAFVGHSGCGKSTLVNLLYRFYDVDKGAVLIDGEDVRDVKQESLRGGMSIVPQECVLFDDTIWNNIKFSRPSTTNEEVWKAIRFAQLDKVMDGMPKKEKTIVGERGVRLSGGEKQRVSIARALLADKKILVLDEATSALDSETEFEIQNSLAKLMKGRTSIIIAHRLSTIMHADLIVVMKKGSIVEMGSHAALLRKKGEYCRLWKLQKGGYIK